ncbi:Proton-coupled amino acid transporter 4 [Papilio xuthus]|uniref:Proton-coupled amino acid transporter 4 n=1 Tax=Papilio xuthus TaxID=66420 RepID=A0A194PF30_PAPXU|nr:Proton-coupled amino acid transporter 4 [Papilio xuthus]
MFIYEFMSGIVETITGSTEEGDFDPHQHRKIEKPTTYSETMIHMLKGSIGAGILAMPSAVQRLGIIVSIIGLTLIGFLATYCILLLIEAQYELCKRWRRGYIAYPKSMMLAVRDGPPGLRWSAMTLYYFVEIVLIFWQLGICVIFFVFVAENVKQICDFHGYEASLRLHLCFVLVPTILLNLVKDLKLMTPLSSISNIVTIFGLILVFFYLIEDDMVLDSEKLRLKKFDDIPIFIGTALFALEAVGVILALEYNMEEPKRFVGMLGLYSVGMITIITLYLIVGVFGYLKYGEEIKATITLNLPQEQKKAQAAKLIFALAIFLTFPLQNYVAYNMVWRRAKKRLPERDGLSENFAQEPVQPKAYFSSKPPSEPVQVIIEPRIMNDLDYKFNSSTSYESRCEFNVTSSLSTLAERPSCPNSFAVVGKILSSLLSTLPLVDSPSEVSTYHFVSQYYDNK